MVMPGVLAESQAGFQGAGGGAAALEPQSGLVENPAGMHGGKAVEAAQCGQAQPVGLTALKRQSGKLNT